MRNGKSVAVVILFFGAMWTPLIGGFLGIGQFRSADENRNLTSWFHDHFGFRGTLITAQALLKVKVLSVSSSPDVVIGKDGWLFYSGERSMDNYRGVLQFAPGELDKWVRSFERRREWLQGRGIEMAIAIVPDKQSVYPEFLPSFIHRVRDRTRLDELMATRTPVIDLRHALIEAKRHSEVYYRTDTHWNDRGVYAGYVEIAKRLGIDPLPFAEKFDSGNSRPGDLPTMLGLGTVWRDIHDPVPHPPAHGAGRRLVMFGDSFLFPLVPYLEPHFERVATSRSAVIDPALIDAERPDIVLFEMVERKLNGIVPEDHI